MPGADPPKKEEASKDGKKDDKKSAASKLLEKKKEEVVIPPTPKEVLHRNIAQIDKFVDTRDNRFLLKTLRYTNFLRGHLPIAELKTAMAALVVEKDRLARLNEMADAVLAFRPEPVVAAPPSSKPSDAPAAAPSSSSAAMAVDDAAAGSSSSSSSSAAAAPAPAAAPARKPVPLPKAGGPASLEIETYLAILLLSMLVHGKQWNLVQRYSLPLIDSLTASNKRTCDLFLARCYAYLSLAAEHASSSSSSGTEGLHDMLVAAHRTATLRHDEYGQAVLLNLLLRLLLENGHKGYDAASKLIARATFPEAASNNQLVRYLYYKGRVQAVALQYQEAHASLMQALRKAPPTAVGFRYKVQASAVVVQLLMGEIPERSVFTQATSSSSSWAAAASSSSSSSSLPAGKPSLVSSASTLTAIPKAALEPYFDLTQAVRAGDLKRFSVVLSTHSAAFAKDDNLSLVARLQANVIKAGLRAIVTSYSKISFKDIAAKLALNSGTGEDDAEMLCARAIRDGVVDASLDHAARCLVSKEGGNVYATREPQEAFHKRIRFCLDVHNEAIRGMRYPSKDNAVLSAEERAEREREEAELEKEIEEGNFDDDGDDD